MFILPQNSGYCKGKGRESFRKLQKGTVDVAKLLKKGLLQLTGAGGMYYNKLVWEKVNLPADTGPARGLGCLGLVPPGGGKGPAGRCFKVVRGQVLAAPSAGSQLAWMLRINSLPHGGRSSPHSGRELSPFGSFAISTTFPVKFVKFLEGAPCQ